MMHVASRFTDHHYQCPHRHDHVQDLVWVSPTIVGMAHLCYARQVPWRPGISIADASFSIQMHYCDSPSASVAQPKCGSTDCPTSPLLPSLLAEARLARGSISKILQIQRYQDPVSKPRDEQSVSVFKSGRNSVISNRQTNPVVIGRDLRH